MERLTNKREADAQREEYERRLANGYPRNIPEERFLRLAAYEDTHMMPSDVTSMRMDMAIIAALFNGVDVDRMKELAEADKDGRLVVLPCKVGDTAYWVHGAVITECRVHRIQENRNGLYICFKSKKSHGAFRTDIFIGKTVFFTREEAEKALEAMKDGN
jgi:hypothetical protein